MNCACYVCSFDFYADYKQALLFLADVFNCSSDEAACQDGLIGIVMWARAWAYVYSRVILSAADPKCSVVTPTFFVFGVVCLGVVSFTSLVLVFKIM